MFDFIKDLIKGLFDFIFEHVWPIVKLAVVTIFKDFWVILLGLVALAGVWYLTGGYDRAEQAYLASQKQADEQAQVQAALEAQKQQNPDSGIYIIK